MNDSNNNYTNELQNSTKIILLLMIKNESSIIERCLKNAIDLVDAVSILDTGSTDNTLELCNGFLRETGKPFDINIEPWKNFGYNRTISFQKCQEFCGLIGWNPETTYALALDADMCLCVPSDFRSYPLTSNAYSIIQKNPVIEYYNVRFLRLGYNWKCTGATHEYWDGEGVTKIPANIIYIDDKNDGGCKDNKFERDVALLLEELKENPDNCRTYFYLAQTLKDLGKLNDAIMCYKKRIELGGWYEEVWYSYYMISKCYMRLNNPSKMELWGLRAYEYYPKRAENIYLLCNYFRGVAQHFKSYHYYKLGKSISYPENDSLFIEKNVYHDLFDFEKTILYYYINPNSLQDGLVHIINYINHNKFIRDIGGELFSDNIYKNMVHYIEPLTSQTYRGQYTKYLFPNFEEYQPSSCSIIYHKFKWIMNIRYVNYLIMPDGSYKMKSEDGNVKTKNALIYLNNNLQPISDVTLLSDSYTKYPSHIEGLEDVRLFEHNNSLMFSATCKDSNNEDTIRVLVGDYNIDFKTLHNITTIKSPLGIRCEKNWINVPHLPSLGNKDDDTRIRFIYSWYPLQVGTLENDELTLCISSETPRFFERFRGSSNICEYLGGLWAITHLVQYTTPRQYHHCLVQFNRNTLRPERYSLPFCFRKNAIEYCLGLSIHDGVVRVVFSENDSNPGLIEFKLDNIRFIDNHCQ